MIKDARWVNEPLVAAGFTADEMRQVGEMFLFAATLGKAGVTSPSEPRVTVGRLQLPLEKQAALREWIQRWREAEGTTATPG